MEFRILGPLEAMERGRPLDLGGLKQRTLLATLLLEANRVVPSDRLIAALWESHPPETAQTALQVYVSGLRKALGKDRLLTKASGYLLRVEEGELDVERFVRLVEQGGAERLREALSLWRGPPLADFTYERFARSEIARLEEARLEALEKRIEADLAAGRHAALVGEVEALVQEHPLREGLRSLLMLALYRSGRQAEALTAYQNARRTLVDELGIEPTPALRELEAGILRQDPALDAPARTGPAATTDAAAVERPLTEPSPSGGERKGARTTEIDVVGRDEELAVVRAFLDAVDRLPATLAIEGEAGIGKTTLWRAATDYAEWRGYRVLSTRPAQAESQLSYTGLADLLEPVL
jgi:DNA-binding SARP family transcriptional activator